MSFVVPDVSAVIGPSRALERLRWPAVALQAFGLSADISVAQLGPALAKPGLARPALPPAAAGQQPEPERPMQLAVELPAVAVQQPEPGWPGLRPSAVGAVATLGPGLVLRFRAAAAHVPALPGRDPGHGIGDTNMHLGLCR